MNISFLLPAIAGLQLVDFIVADNRLTLFLSTTPLHALCPLCRGRSERIHSHYHRTVADLPWADKQVILQLQVRRFFCDQPECRRKVFCERLHPAIAVYARRTARLESYLQTLGLQLGGEGAALLFQLLHICTISADSFLNLVRKMPAVHYPTPKILGVDEWALRSGKSYATILVDLESRRVIDLLEDAKRQTLQTWLTAHPGVAVISRDRDATFAEAARAGAPEALQVADRWHLLKNLGDALKRLLEANPAGLQATAAALLFEEPDLKEITAAVDSLPEAGPAPTSKSVIRHRQVKELAVQGWPIRKIAKQLHMHRQTVKKYIQLETVPKKRYSHSFGSKRSLSNHQLEYLAKRWAEGDANAKQLWQELKEQGYSGAASSVYRAVAHFPPRATAAVNNTVWKVLPPVSARTAMWLLVKPKAELSEKKQKLLAALLDHHPQAKVAYPLAQHFIRLVKERQAENLDAWVKEAKGSGIAPLKQFAAGLERDYQAVKAGLSLAWSNGQVEGQITRLKLIKRQAYGRASLDLLKKRVLYKPHAQAA